MRRATSVALVVPIVGLVLAIAGCNRSYLNENDRLRGRVADLELDVAALERRNEELAAELAAGTRPAATLPPEIREIVPHVAAVDIGRLSHARGEAPDTILVLYIEPRDGRGRFVQMVGSLSVTVAMLAAEEPARTIGRVDLSPRDLRDAYRSSFAGQHYSVTVPLTLDARPRSVPMTCDARVHYEDATTGRSLTAHREITIGE